ncbi:MAG: integrase [Candidatus Bathyarchaeota archaeon]|nr:integrase [Candidatus Bathyarchaeota archaeon]
MDGAGFEPATSAMPTLAKRVRISEKHLIDFEEFLRINLRLAPTTVQKTLEDAKRFLEKSNYIVSYHTVLNYLKGYINNAPKTYNAQITSLRRFIKVFLGCAEIISTFKMSPVDEVQKPIKLPTKEQLRKGFETQEDVRAKAIYLFTAKSGLRRCEILALLKENVNLKLRSVIPNHYTRKKRSGITFYDSETEKWLNKYLQIRTDNDPRLFVISDRQWRKIWRYASKIAKTKIAPQILRVWFSTEMGEQLIPDRFIDIFQGRAPRSVLAKHYTGKELLRLKRIYEKANLSLGLA